MCHWVRTGLYVLVASLAISTLSLAQNPLTPGEAQRIVTALLGKQPDRLETYFLHGTNYLAFGLTTDRLNNPEKKDIWIYTRSPDDKEFHQLWHDTMSDLLPERFVEVAGHSSACLLLEGGIAGSGGSTTRLGLYCIDADKFVEVDYLESWSSTGRHTITIDATRAADPSLRAYLESQGHKVGLDKPDILTDPENLENVEQAWIDDNGYATSGTIRIRYYGALKYGLMNGPITIKDKQCCVDLVHDGRYDWYSLFKGPVGGFDRLEHRYFLVYVQKDRYSWAGKLNVMGDWLYIRPQDGHWSVRFNKVTHKLEMGDFDSLVVQGKHPSAAPLRPKTEQSATIIVRAYQLVQNPFAHEGKPVDLAPWQWPMLYNGQVYSWSRGANAQVGYVGLRFNRMLEPQTAVFDVMAQDMTAPGELESVGQIIVILPPDVSRLDIMKTWVVIPLGTTDGTNYLGAVIHVPTVRFLKYIGQ